MKGRNAPKNKNDDKKQPKQLWVQGEWLKPSTKNENLMV